MEGLYVQMGRFPGGQTGVKPLTMPLSLKKPSWKKPLSWKNRTGAVLVCLGARLMPTASPRRSRHDKPLGRASSRSTHRENSVLRGEFPKREANLDMKWMTFLPKKHRQLAPFWVVQLGSSGGSAFLPGRSPGDRRGGKQATDAKHVDRPIV